MNPYKDSVVIKDICPDLPQGGFASLIWYIVGWLLRGYFWCRSKKIFSTGKAQLRVRRNFLIFGSVFPRDSRSSSWFVGGPGAEWTPLCWRRGRCLRVKGLRWEGHGTVFIPRQDEANEFLLFAAEMNCSILPRFCGPPSQPLPSIHLCADVTSGPLDLPFLNCKAPLPFPIVHQPLILPATYLPSDNFMSPLKTPKRCKRVKSCS